MIDSAECYQTIEIAFENFLIELQNHAKLKIIMPFWPRLQNSQLLKQLEKGVPIHFAVLPDGGCVKEKR